MKTIGTLALAALVALFSGGAIAQGKSVKKAQLIGSWTLVSVVLTESDGKKLEPFGPNPRGYMNLDRSGRFSLLLFRSGTPKFAVNNRMKATDAEYKAAGQNSIAYFGTHKVNEKDGEMDLHIEQSTFPNMDGDVQKRILKLIGDELRLTNPVVAGRGTAELVWKRVK